MALIVVPLEMKHIFYGLDSDNSTSNGTLIDSLHHLAGNGENQTTDEMIVATNSESETVSVSCQTQVFFHLFVICTRSWSIAAFILLHHMHDGIIPVGSLVEFQVTKNRGLAKGWQMSTICHYSLKDKEKRVLNTTYLSHQKQPECDILLNLAMRNGNGNS